MRGKIGYHARSHGPGSSDPMSGPKGAIFYDYNNVGGYLKIETTDSSPDGMQFAADEGQIRFFVDDLDAGAFRVDAPFIRFDTDGASLRLLDNGETFFECDGGASWYFDNIGIGVDGVDSNGEFAIAINNTSTGAFIIQDHSGNPIFRVDEDGDLHGKTGKSLVFDL